MNESINQISFNKDTQSSIFMQFFEIQRLASNLWPIVYMVALASRMKIRKKEDFHDPLMRPVADRWGLLIATAEKQVRNRTNFLQKKV